nr:SPOR domain-containing protein [Thiorhodovibrio frisius]
MLSLTPASNSLVLNSVRYGIQLGAFGLEESARQLAREKSADGQSLYFFRSGPNGKMIAVIQGLYSTNQEVSDDLLEARRKYPKAWPRRFDPGAELTLFNPGAAQ